MTLSMTQRFFSRAGTLANSERDVVDLFVYHLTVELDHPAASAAAVRSCYQHCDLAVPVRLAQILSEGLSTKPRRLIKVADGYRLERGRRLEFDYLLGGEGGAIETSAALSRLEEKIATDAERDFLSETIKCFDAKAYRAAVVMCWNLALHHLQTFILSNAHALSAFNAVLAVNKDGRVKVKTIAKLDDFTEMPEGKFLSFLREAKLITTSLYNKLKARLDERNAAAHPSGIKVTPKAAEAYIEDLVENVMRKF